MFHEFASEWFEAKRTEGGRHGKGLSPAGEASLRWQLVNHLLPAFAKCGIDAIGARTLTAGVAPRSARAG